MSPRADRVTIGICYHATAHAALSDLLEGRYMRADIYRNLAGLTDLRHEDDTAADILDLDCL